MASDLTVVILTKDEKLHLARCLNKLLPLEPREVYVVDCHSTDGTQEIARRHGAIVVEHDWPGNQAVQFNWALDNLDLKTEWILRLDADEYLYRETAEEMRDLIQKKKLPERVTSISISRARMFFGRTILHGTSGIILLRAFRKGFGRSTYALMDEHLVTTSGATYVLKGQFVDDSRISIAEWTAKHVGYARREAIQSLLDPHGNKARYYKLPKFFRCFAYFVYRYFFRLGFLDGAEGFLWHFLQGFWYRVLVDAEILEIEKRAFCGRYYGSKKEKIEQAIAEGERG